MRLKGGIYASYENYKYCTQCGNCNDESGNNGWYEKIGEGYGQRCPVHRSLLRGKKRYLRSKG